MQLLSSIEKRFVINTAKGDLQIVFLNFDNVFLFRSSQKTGGFKKETSRTITKNITAWAMNDRELKQYILNPALKANMVNEI